MARTTKIDFAQVAQIADSMTAAGSRPTARAVRERIGSGSMGTIHKLLQQWAGKTSAESIEREAAELPASIAEAFSDYVATAIAEACEPLANAATDARLDCEAMAAENERLEKIITDMETENAALREQREFSIGESQAIRQQMEAERAELAAAKADIETSRLFYEQV